MMQIFTFSPFHTPRKASKTKNLVGTVTRLEGIDLLVGNR
jgi:hypothetical protein